MNKTFAVILLCFITIKAANAQTEKGSQSLGLSFGVSTNKQNIGYLDPSTNIYGPDANSKQTTYYIVPAYSYFIADKLDLGIGIGYGQSTTKYSGNNNNGNLSNVTTKNLSASIALRKYFLFEDKIGIRTGPYFSYARLTNDNEYPNILMNIIAITIQVASV